MDHPILLWCVENNLDARTAEQLVSPTVGIQSVSELSLLSPVDIEEITAACRLSIGERLRLRRAIAHLNSFVKPDHHLEAVRSEELEAQREPTRPVSYPFDIFDEKFDPGIPLPDIHAAVRAGLAGKWSEKVHGLMMQKVKNHLESGQVGRFLVDTNCPLNVVGAVVYYTCNTRMFLEEEKHSIYKIINPLLAKRNRQDLKLWQPFLFYLCSAEQHFPAIKKPMAFRGVNTALATDLRYGVGNNIVWPAFTSVTTKQEKMKDFASGSGSWIMIDQPQAIDISRISFCPEDEEGLLFPNSAFEVVEVMEAGSPLSGYLGVPKNIDVLRLTQKPTPEDFKPLQILSKRKMSHGTELGSTVLYELGRHYYAGQDQMPKDFQKASECFSLAARKGHPASQLFLGKMYIKGLGMHPDLDQGLEYCRLSANQGFIKAQIFLGKMYCRSLQITQPYQADQATVLDSAKYLYPVILSHKVMKNCSKNISYSLDFLKKAVEYLEMAASQENTQAMFYLGQIYADGPLEDCALSMKFFQKASARGHAMSQNSLGMTSF